MVDVVVRDRNRQPLRGLSKADFVVLENGIRQDIATFSVVDLSPDRPAAAFAEQASSRSSQQPTQSDRDPPAVTALVFEQLSPAARRLAEEAATEFVLKRANEAQIAFYTFDAAGLRADTRLGTAFGTDSSISLQVLADETGGAFVENTNELIDGVRRVASDTRYYYLLGYSPTRRPDDKYREIEVRVLRDDVRVLARKGYRATVDPYPTQVRAYEAAPLLLLDGPSLPDDFPMQIRGLRFPSPAHPGRVAVVARVPMSALTYVQDQAGRYEAAVSVVARVKDAQDRVRGFVSDRFQVTGALDQVDVSKRGEILFYKEPVLPTGVHTLEVLAYDEYGHTASARLQTVEVPRLDASDLHASSLLIVRSAERATRGDAKRTPALQFGRWLIVPNLGEPLRTGTELAFAFAVHAHTTSSRLRARAGIFSNGRQTASASLDLEPPDETGRVTYVGRIPLGSLEPGTYQLGVTVERDDSKITLMETFRLEAAPRATAKTPVLH